MADDPVPFQFPPQQPFAESPPAEEFREPKRKRGPRKVKAEAPKKRGPKPGSKRKQKAVSIFENSVKPVPETQRPLTLAELMDAINKVRAVTNTMPPVQRKELLTYLLGQQ